MNNMYSNDGTGQTDRLKSDKIYTKYDHLLKIIRGLGKTAVAFSGGVDSTFLLAAAQKAPAERLIALTMRRPYIAQWELDEADSFIKQMGVEQHVLDLPVDDEVRNNVPNRCYFCKSSTFRHFRDEMEDRIKQYRKRAEKQRAAA